MNDRVSFELNVFLEYLYLLFLLCFYLMTLVVRPIRQTEKSALGNLMGLFQVYVVKA